MTRFKLLRQKKSFDYWIAILAIFFCSFGVLMIYEASNVIAFRDFGDKYHYIRDQLVWLGLGLIGMTITSFLPYKKLRLISFPLFLVSLILLMAVFIPGVGIKALGARRWIGYGSFTLQPSELAKISVILYLSSWLSFVEKKRFLAFLLLLVLVVGLVILQPDLGTGVILMAILAIIYFLSGAPLWHFMILLPILGSGILALAVTSPYRFQRLITFLNPNLDPLGASYHIRQILISFGSGGIWGLGLGGSRQKYQFLPEATTDSIFAIIGEEFGYLGALLFIILLIIFLYRLYKVSRHAADKQSFLLSGGIFALLATQTLINLGSMVAIFPLTGVPLPFISYGGSNLIVSLICVGIVLNISKNTVQRHSS